MLKGDARVTASISLTPDTEITGDIFCHSTGLVSGRLGIGQAHVWSSDPAQLRALAIQASMIADELECAISEHARKERAA